MIEILGTAARWLGGIVADVVKNLIKTSTDNATKAAPEMIGRLLSRGKQEHRYLANLVGAHELMPLLPTTLVAVSGGAHNQELDDVYVSLTFDDGTHRTTDISLVDALQKSTRILILGEPGAGKTTVLRFLALTIARARLGTPRRDSSDPHRERKRIRDSRLWLERELGWKKYPIPILVYLNRLHDVCSRPEGISLLDLIRDDWSDKTLNDDLYSGKYVFLLDGFDEVVTQAARDRVAQLVGALTKQAPECRYIVTSRFVGYRGQLADYGFRAYRIQSLSWDLICRLVTNWYTALGKPSGAAELLQRLQTNSGIRELAVNPMLLSLIALVQYTHGLIPERRHVLYDECVKILLDRRFAPAHVQQHFRDSLPTDEALTLLTHVAYRMHYEHLREVPKDKMEKEFIPEALELMPLTTAASRSSSALLENVEDRSQILIERGLNDQGIPMVAFAHLSFQEYLAALALHRSISLFQEVTVSQKLLDLYEANKDWWEEVALLYAAQLETSQRKAFFERLVSPATKL